MCPSQEPLFLPAPLPGFCPLSMAPLFNRRRLRSEQLLRDVSTTSSYSILYIPRTLQPSSALQHPSHSMSHAEAQLDSYTAKAEALGSKSTPQDKITGRDPQPVFTFRHKVLTETIRV